MIEEILRSDVNHRIRVENEKTLDQLVELAAGRTLHFDFTVKQKREVRCGKEVNTLFDLEHPFGMKRLLLIRQYGKLHDVFLYETPEWFEEGSRVDLLDKHDWLFETEEEHEYLADYPYAPEIYDEHDNIYSRVQRDEKGQNQGGGIHTFLMEYKANPSVENDRVLLVEEGDIDSDNGGWIEFYEGSLIEDFNVSV